MLVRSSMWKLVTCCLTLSLSVMAGQDVALSLENSIVWGPGLNPESIVMPARYFFISAIDKNGDMLKRSPGNAFVVHITGSSSKLNKCGVSVNILDRKDGSFIVRYKLFETCYNFEISVTHKGKHISSSPYKFKGPVYDENCYCPHKSLDSWLNTFGCNKTYPQITKQLQAFQKVDFDKLRTVIVDKFNDPGRMSICNYVIKSNEVYSKCYGKYVGFKIFMDSVLLSLARKVYLPDVEFFINIGDWPLVKREHSVLPIFSWCGSDDTWDIVLPTYDITQATLECMGRVSLDMLSVQGMIEKTWEEKEEKAFWRGRDACRERLDLVDIARKHPDLFNVSLTNFFFFRNEEEKYGPKEKHISFFKFFDYKYMINIDGTVAAYRFPFLLAGNSVVFKQDSKYKEHFYDDLVPWEHYIPVKRNLSDLVEKIRWAMENDDTARQIGTAGQKFAQSNLMPQNIFCYHAALFHEWSKRLVSEVKIGEGMDHVPQPSPKRPEKGCTCQESVAVKDEL